MRGDVGKITTVACGVNMLTDLQAAILGVCELVIRIARKHANALYTSLPPSSSFRSIWVSWILRKHKFPLSLHFFKEAQTWSSPSVAIDTFSSARFGLQASARDITKRKGETNVKEDYASDGLLRFQSPT